MNALAQLIADDETLDEKDVPELQFLRALYRAEEYASQEFSRASCKLRVKVRVHYTCSVHSGAADCEIYRTQVSGIADFFKIRMRNTFPEYDDFEVTMVEIVEDVESK